MVFLRELKGELKNLLTGRGFFLCIVFTTLLCFTSNLYVAGFGGEKFMILESIFRFDWDFKCNDPQFFFPDVIRFGKESYITLFVPILTAYISIPLLCDEYRSGYARFRIFRGRRNAFYASKYLSAGIAAGVAVAIGFLCFSLLVLHTFPGIRDVSPDMVEILAAFYGGAKNLEGMGIAKLIFIDSLQMFFYGALAVVPSFLLSGFSKNKYILLCIPFFMKYATDQWCQRIMSGVSAGDYGFDSLLYRVSRVIDPEAVADYSHSELMLPVAIYSLTVFTVGLLGYICIERHHVDVGEGE